MECEEFTSENEDSSESDKITQLITEEDYIDSFFYACDIDQHGKVPVSRIIEYLKCTAENHEISNLHWDKLYELFDPTNMDFCIDISTYRSLITKWLAQDNIEGETSDMDSEACADTKDLLVRGVGDSAVKGRNKKTRMKSNHHSPILQLLHDSPNSSGHTLEQRSLFKESHDIDVGETLNQLSELQFNNKKLADENSKLMKQLENADEVISQNTIQLQELNKLKKSYQCAIERILELRNDNDELKSATVTADDRFKNVEKNVQTLLKEKSIVESKCICLEAELSKALENFELAKNDIVTLQTIANEQKQLKMEAKDLAEINASTVVEKNRLIEELQQVIEEFRKTNESLRREKSDLELQLSQTQHELASARIKVDNLGGSDSSNADSSDEPVDEEEESMPAPLRLFNNATTSSTPFKKSIRSEIKSQIHESPCLPSPLCDKELENILLDFEESFEEPKSKIPDEDIREILKSTRKLKKKSSRVGIEFKQRKDVMMQHIAELVVSKPPTKTGAAELNQHKNHKIDQIKAKLQCEIDLFAQKIASLASTNQNYQQRITRLTEALKNVKDHNTDLEEHHREAFSAIKMESEKLTSALEDKTKELNNEIENTSLLKDKIASLEKDVSLYQNERDVLQCENESLKESNSSLTKELHHIKKLHEDLEVRYHKTEDCMNELQTTLHEKEQTLQDSNEKFEHCIMERQQDMRDLWRLVQKDIEFECQDSDGQDSPKKSTGNELREEVTKEILSLRSQLARSEKALAILQSKTLPLRSISTDGYYPVNVNANDNSPSSPLVDALTLDPFLSIYPENCTKRSGHSADSILDSTDSAYYDSNFNLRASESTSCPQLEDKLVTHSTQTDPCLLKPSGSKRRPPQIGASRYQAVNTSTGSSTSGVEVSSVSTNRSGDAYPYHKKSVLIVETACTPDLSSPEDTDNPLCRHRTSSFKRAIERGQSNDSSNQSFETNDPESSPDLSPDKSYVCLDTLLSHQSYEQVPSPQQPQEIVVNLALKPDQFSIHNTSKGSIIVQQYPQTITSASDFCKHRWGTPGRNSDTVDLKLPESILKDTKKASKKVTGIAEEECGDIWELEQDNPDDIMDQVFVDDNLHQNPNLLSVADLEGRLSPGQTRRLSTLPEEGSDAEAEESVNGSQHPVPPPRCKKSPPRSSVPCGVQTSTCHNSTGLEPSADHLIPICTDGSDGSVPPYKGPPAYKEALQNKNKDSSTQRLAANEQTAIEGKSPPPYKRPDLPIPPKTQPPPPYSRSLSPNSVKLVKSPQPRQIHEQTESLECAENTVHMDKPISAMGRERRKSLEESRNKSNLMSIGKHGELVDLVNGELEEVELSEADKILNAKLIEEARQASINSKHRDKLAQRRSKNSKSGSNEKGASGLSEGSVTTDPNLLTGDDASTQVDDTVAQNNVPLTQQQAETEKNQETEKPESELVVTEKKEPVVSRTPQTPPSCETSPKPFRINSTELNKIREENIAKRKTLLKQGKMPELKELSDSSENGLSEPLQAKGRTADASKGREVFPSISDDMLAKLKLRFGKGEKKNEQLTEQEIEDKFAGLSLAFKTDKLTLEKRIELHKRARDVAEQNIERELEGLKDALKAIGTFCTDPASRDIYAKIQRHVEVLELSTSRMSSRSEVHGAVQQEMRMNQAVEVMFTHVENLKRMYEKEHAELEETKKLLQDNSVGDDNRRQVTLAGSIGAKGGRRRASVAAFPRAALSSISIGSSGNTSPLPKDLDPRLRLNSLLDSAGPMSSPHPLLGGTVQRRMSVITTGGAVRRASFAVSPCIAIDATSAPLNPAVLPRRRYMTDPDSDSTSIKEESSSLNLSPTVQEKLERALANNNNMSCETKRLDNSKHDSDNSGSVVDTVEKKERRGSIVRIKRITSRPSITEDDIEVKKEEKIEETFIELPAITKPAITKQNEDSELGSNDNEDHEQYEEAYQRGYEAGLSSSLGIDFDLLKEHLLSGTLEEYLEEHLGLSSNKKNLFLDRLWNLLQNVTKDKLWQKLRFAIAGLIFFVSVLCLVFTFLPHGQASHHHTHRKVDVFDELRWPWLPLDLYHKEKPVF